jgi:iron complex outermembrane receptor protein
MNLMNKGRSLSGWVGGMLPLLVLVLPAGAESASMLPQGMQEDTLQPTPAAPQLSDLDQPMTTVADWLAQIEASLTQITAVRVEATDAGLQVVLEIAEGELVAPATQTVGNALIADIPNAVLALPDEDAFEAFGPAEGIALVAVTNEPGDRVRVAITGTDAPPVAQVSTTAQGLVLGVTLGTPTETARDDDRIQVVVTATRTEEEINRIPRSVTVIDREDLDTQTILSPSLTELLSREVPGFAPVSPAGDDRGFLRGRTTSYLIDGIPTPAFPARNQSIIGLDAIERIEVVRGPNAVFGAEATGGTVNIITRRPEVGEFNVFAEIGTTAAAGGGNSFLIGEGFGYFLRFGFSGNEAPVDYLFSFSYEREGSLFDAEGDRIFFARPRDEDRTINILGRLGFNINEEQRLQLTVNHYDNERVNNEFIADIEGSDEAGKAQGVRTGEQEFIDTSPFFDRNTIISLVYSHDNLFGNSLQAQGYYRNYSGLTSGLFDEREFGDDITNRDFLDIEGWGGRLQIETPLWRQASLLWGADYDYDQRDTFVDFIDPVAFDESGGRVIRRLERRNTRAYSVADLGLFAQLQWDLTDQLRLAGGLRYSNFDVNVSSYTSLFGVDVEAGGFNFDGVVFNAGAVYQITDEINLFANFAQGFSLPNLNRFFFNPPAGFDFSTDTNRLRPVNVNNYELGVRGNWNSVRFSLAGFFSDSQQDDVVRFTQLADGSFETEFLRVPQREYGIEATLDWQPSEDWLLGTTLSWQEGDIDFEDTGDFLPQTGYAISPLKWTAYVENQTLPRWRNRLQLLAVGGRSRNFEGGGFDPRATDGYVVVDYISSINIGGGTLNIGIENLFNNQYLVPGSQLSAAFDGFAFRAPASRGRTISANYRITF